MVPAESKLNCATSSELADTPVVRTRACAPDPFLGLKGHAYIKARNLAPSVQRVQTSAHAELGQAKETCK